MEVCRSLSRFTTGAFLSLDYLELFLWGIADLDDKVINSVGRLSLIHQVSLGIVQSTNDDAVFIVVQGNVIALLFHRSHLIFPDLCFGLLDDGRFPLIHGSQSRS